MSQDTKAKIKCLAIVCIAIASGVVISVFLHSLNTTFALITSIGSGIIFVSGMESISFLYQYKNVKRMVDNHYFDNVPRTSIIGSIGSLTTLVSTIISPFPIILHNIAGYISTGGGVFCVVIAAWSIVQSIDIAMIAIRPHPKPLKAKDVLRK